MVVRLVSLCLVHLLFFACEIRSGVTNDCAIFRCKMHSNSSSVPSCGCDNECELYNDCCSDFKPSALNGSSVTSPLHQLMECSRIDFTGNLVDSGGKGVPMVSGCLQPTEHQGQYTNASLFLPVTDPLTNLTFRNIYCAQGNNISRDQVILWIPQFSCPL